MNRRKYINPFNGLDKETYLSLTKPAAVNYVIQDDGATAVMDISGYIGRDIIREWMTGETSPNTADNIQNALREISADKIIVNINSPGGDLNDGLVIADMLQSKRAEVVTNIMGFSASAATVIGQAGSTGKRRMSKNAFYLAHRVMFGVMGYINQNTTAEMSADMETIDTRLINFFEERATISADEIADLMDSGGGYGKWISAEEALEFGFIDEVYDPADEEDEDTDHMEGDDRENRMRNIQKLNASGKSMFQEVSTDMTEIEDLNASINQKIASALAAVEIKKNEEESKTNSGSSASARARFKNKAKALTYKYNNHE